MDPALTAKDAQIQAMARYAEKLSVSLDGANLEITNMKVSSKIFDLLLRSFFVLLPLILPTHYVIFSLTAFPIFPPPPNPSSSFPPYSFKMKE